MGKYSKNHVKCQDINANLLGVVVNNSSTFGRVILVGTILKLIGRYKYAYMHISTYQAVQESVCRCEWQTQCGDWGALLIE